MEETTTKYCTNCGSQIEVGIRFCGNCGSRVSLTESSEISSSGNRCYYCQSEMALDAIRCPKCSKYLQEIEKDKNTFRTFNTLAIMMCGGVFFLMIALGREFFYNLKYNSGFRTFIIIFWVIGLIFGLLAVPAWNRFRKRTGEWLYF
ncbi:MAG: zinc ribbon domain-containing protein [candidate division WOR-3 bacterium]